MRSVLFVLLATAMLSLAGGCAKNRARHRQPLFDGLSGRCSDCPETCQSCDEGCGECCEPECAPVCERPQVDPGPPSGAVAYPYYTTRGPRDFLARNPRSIGP